MINCNTQFGKLKTVIVGKELELPTRIIDITFKHFYKEALGLGLYNSQNVGYSINSEILRKRVIQLDNLAKTLSDLGITVFRPNKVTQVKKVLTPYYSTEHSSPNNVRDITLVYNDTIVETPVCIRNRVFENLELHSVFKKMFDNGKGGKWIKAPNTHLVESTYDLVDWKENRDDFFQYGRVSYLWAKNLNLYGYFISKCHNSKGTTRKKWEGKDMVLRKRQ